jgi:hypothetical protein
MRKVEMALIKISSIVAMNDNAHSVTRFSPLHMQNGSEQWWPHLYTLHQLTWEHVVAERAHCMPQ